MFLTEKQGGSDVGANETVAEQADDDTYRLTGEKWFCSNIDAIVRYAPVDPDEL
jgi:acyl-CoA dehydrogenase